jgi:hypothetical protein
MDFSANTGRHRGRGMDELPRFEVDHYEDIMAAEPEVADLDEVAGPDARSLLAKEGGPTLAVRRLDADPAQVPLDGSLGDGDAQFEELAADALRSPEAIFGSHAANEVDDLGGEALCARRLPPRAPLPEEPKALSVPAKKRVGLDEHRCVPPAREHRGEGHQERSVRGAKLGLLDSSGGNQELLAEERVLDEEFSAGAQEIGEEPSYRRACLEQARGLREEADEERRSGRSTTSPLPQGRR